MSSSDAARLVTSKKANAVKVKLRSSWRILLSTGGENECSGRASIVLNRAPSVSSKYLMQQKEFVFNIETRVRKKKTSFVIIIKQKQRNRQNARWGLKLEKSILIRTKSKNKNKTKIIAVIAHVEPN